MLLRYPPLGLKGKVLDSIVLNIDLAPTMLDYAGVAAPESMQGRSWRQLLEGKADGWRKAFFYCYFYERGFGTPKTTAVRTETAKLIRYPGHDQWTEVFDLSRDPYEVRNLASDPQAPSLRKELEAACEREPKAIRFEVPAFADPPGSGKDAESPKKEGKKSAKRGGKKTV